MISLGYVWIVLIVGFIFGWIARMIFEKIRPHYDGAFIIDDTNQETQQWTLQYNADPNDILQKRSLKFRVQVVKK